MCVVFFSFKLAFFKKAPVFFFDASNNRMVIVDPQSHWKPSQIGQMVTLPETNSKFAPENRPKRPKATIHFQVRAVSFRECK